MRPRARLVLVLALEVAGSGCRRPKVGLRGEARRALTGLTYVARVQPALLTLDPGQAPPERYIAEGDALGGPRLVVAVPVSGAPPGPGAPPLTQGPPADGLRDALLSLTPEGQAIAPPLATLPFYEVALKLSPEQGKLEATVTLDYPNTTGAPLAELPLRIFANARGPLLRLGAVVASGCQAVLVPGADPTLQRITLTPPLAPGAWLHLGYAVSGEVPESPGGGPDLLAASLLSEPARAPDYGLFARFPGGLALADWLPMVAARFEGAFDVAPPGTVGDTAFSDVASFRATVDLPRVYTLVGPGVTLGEETLPGSLRRTHLALGAGRDLTLFASKGYRSAGSRDGNTRVQVVFQEGHGEKGQEVLRAAQRALSQLSKNLGPYPWVQLSAVEVPLGGGAGGAEFSSLVAIAGMFFTPTAPVGFGLALSGPFLSELREFTVTHEVAHQWWAIQVGSHPRLEPDVDEPLAQATAALVLTSGPGGQDRNRTQIFDRQVAINYQAMRLLGGEDGPAARATSDFENTPVYAGLVYGKAPLFYEQLAQTLGDSPFWLGLRTYAATYRFKTARRGDVLTAFADKGLVGRDKLDSLFERWFGGAHGDEDLAHRGDPAEAAGELFGGQGADDGSGGEDLENLDPAALVKAARAALAAAAQGQGSPKAAGQPLFDPGQAAQMLKQFDSTMGGADLP